jgi:orotidine-5'-phosphate decarboxylase
MTDARQHLALVLDTDDLDAARAHARRFAAWFATVKVGYELYAAAGPAALDALHEDGFAVFLDLKLLDIPTTVERGARVLGRRGADFLNLHAVGGLDMLRAGVRGLAEGAREGGHPPPVALAVTVLTSEADTSAVPARLELARTAGCDGVVCAAAEARAARDAGLAPMVPGIRLAGSPKDDQARAATPREAVEAGAAWLLIGRTVSAAADPERAAAEVVAEVEAALADGSAPGRGRDR